MYIAVLVLWSPGAEPLSIRALSITLIGLFALHSADLYSADVSEDRQFVEERRLRLWSAQTKNRDLVYSTYRRIDHLRGEEPGSWVYEWSQIGAYFADAAESLATGGNRIAARDAYLTAAKFFGIARFPAKTLPGQRTAYIAHLENYEKAGAFFDSPLVIVDIPFDNGHVRGYLHLPNDVAKPPLILWNGGIDTWKGDSYNNIQPYIDRGFAVLTFDVLGTGESSNWAAKFDSNNLHGAVIDFMQDNPLIDGRYQAHVGFSFSGYYAARNAVTEDRLFAIISACGPIHDGWANIYDGSWEIQEALSSAIHMRGRPAEAIHQYMQGFSLVNQGLLTATNSVKLPTLIVNGDLDDIAPVADLRRLADAGQETDL